MVIKLQLFIGQNDVLVHENSICDQRGKLFKGDENSSYFKLSNRSYLLILHPLVHRNPWRFQMIYS